jgi:acetyl-CoA carboxylase carboxyltransferase component
MQGQGGGADMHLRSSGLAHILAEAEDANRAAANHPQSSPHQQVSPRTQSSAHPFFDCIIYMITRGTAIMCI